MMRRSFLFLFCMWAASSGYLTAIAQVSGVPDQRTHDLYNEIRCPVCSGQSIAESDVPISITLRRYVQAQVDAGESDETIKQNLVERYGQEILFAPALAPMTLPLWLAPWIILVFLLGGLWIRTGRSRADKQ